MEWLSYAHVFKRNTIIPLEVLQVDAICQNFSIAEIFNIEPNL